MTGARLWRALGALATGRGGNVGLIFALVLPGLLVTGLGAIELNQVLADKKRTQDVADTAALMGAGQLSVTPIGADQRAQAFAQAQLADIAAAAKLTVKVAIGATAGGPTMTVAVDTQRTSFFGNLLPPGGFHTHVTAVAMGVNTAPLCVLSLMGQPADQLHLTGQSQVQAGSCLVHSNGAVNVDGGSSLLASLTEASTTASGSITPSANVQAPSVADPFAGLPVNATCPAGPLAASTTIAMTQSLSPKTFTGPVNISGAGTVTLGAGEYYFCGPLTISGAVKVVGNDAVLVFAKNASLNFSGVKPGGMGLVQAPIGPSLYLSGRTAGALAGFVLIADRSATGTFTVQSDYITNLTGTVYTPTTTLEVTGSSVSGSTTPWTVVAGEALKIDGGAQLVINANYAISNVPVPKGVGNQRNGSGSQLTQ